MGKFFCDQCCACCRCIKELLMNSSKLPEPYLTEVLKSGLEFKPDGSCSKLSNGKCTIYDSRPVICNVEEIYRLYFAEKQSSEGFFLEASKGCNELRKIYGIKLLNLEELYGGK